MRQKSTSDLIIDGALRLFLIVLMMTMLFPFVYIFAVSFSTYEEIFENPLVLWPKQWTTSSYEYILQSRAFVRSMGITAGVALASSLLVLLFNSMTAFALTRPIKARGAIMFLFVFTLLFSGGLIPSYLLVKALGLINTYGALIIPGVVGAWTVIIFRQFIFGIPEELIDAAMIDGAHEWQIYTRIILPLSKPIMAAFFLFNVVGTWNSWFSAVIYLNDPAKWTIQVVLRQMIIENDPMMMLSENRFNGPAPSPITIQMAAILVATAPILIIYPFLQKHFVKGVMIGSLKG
ncbi:carbohydrate ABC transporter permease [Paenibacillus cymbidii]|uniref:carbohydrate ABC transporter permease n=1 Tax=Paenibacillus cymbidii TaxID=1639034 RepID=UPI001081CA11|nr:carbohydrate ABC transporter permease [Paenibacillus cymbidii]